MLPGGDTRGVESLIESSVGVAGVVATELLQQATKRTSYCRCFIPAS